MIGVMKEAHSADYYSVFHKDMFIARIYKISTDNLEKLCCVADRQASPQ